MDVKYTCAFCGKSNTKIEGIYSGGLFSKKIGEKEVVDKDAATMMRCSSMNCGKFLHKECLSKLGKKSGGLFKTTVYFCPKCESKMVSL